jgi:tRNA(Ile)-lysidine synthetase-like protein
LYLEKNLQIAESPRYTVSKQISYHLGGELDPGAIWSEVQSVMPLIEPAMRVFLDGAVKRCGERAWPMPTDTDIAVSSESLGVRGIVDKIFADAPYFAITRSSEAPAAGVYAADRIRVACYCAAVRETLDLPAGIVAERIGGTLSFASERSPDVEISYSHKLLVPGRTPVPEIGVAIETEVSAGPIDYVRPRGSMEVVLDYQALCGDLVVRSWQPGDRIRPLGLRGTKKVQDIFVDHRIPRRERARVPLLTDGEKVLWVAGISVSDEAKVSPTTRESLLIRMVQI